MGQTRDYILVSNASPFLSHVQRGGATPGSPYQYYQLGATHRKSGNPVHTFETEELLMRTMAKDERIKFCDASGCVGSTTH